MPSTGWKARQDGGAKPMAVLMWIIFTWKLGIEWLGGLAILEPTRWADKAPAHLLTLLQSFPWRLPALKPSPQVPHQHEARESHLSTAANHALRCIVTDTNAAKGLGQGRPLETTNIYT